MFPPRLANIPTYSEINIKLDKQQKIPKHQHRAVVNPTSVLTQTLKAKRLTLKSKRAAK